MDILDYIVFNQEKWSTKRAALIHWVNTNHPGLSGFIHDQSGVGAMKFLKAIEHYTETQDK